MRTLKCLQRIERGLPCGVVKTFGRRNQPPWRTDHGVADRMKVHESLLIPHPVPDVQADILNKGRRILRGRDLTRGLKPQNSVLEVLAPRTETCVGRFHVQCAADCSKLLFSANIRENVPLRMGMTAHLLLDAVAACTSRCKRHIAVF